jgi:hypothetical protein
MDIIPATLLWALCDGTRPIAKTSPKCRLSNSQISKTLKTLKNTQCLEGTTPCPRILAWPPLLDGGQKCRRFSFSKISEFDIIAVDFFPPISFSKAGGFEVKRRVKNYPPRMAVARSTWRVQPTAGQARWDPWRGLRGTPPGPPARALGPVARAPRCAERGPRPRRRTPATRAGPFLGECARGLEGS